MKPPNTSAASKLTAIADAAVGAGGMDGEEAAKKEPKGSPLLLLLLLLAGAAVKHHWMGKREGEGRQRRAMRVAVIAAHWDQLMQS